MKNLTLALILLSPLALAGQVEKGNVFVGGSVTVFTTSQSGYPNSSSVTLSPTIGKFINANNALGVSANYNFTHSPGNYRDYSLSLSVFHRYYIPISEKFYFVWHSQVTGGFGQNEELNNDNLDKLTSFGIATGPRFTYFASKHWAFEARYGSLGVAYSGVKPSNYDAPNYSTTTVSFSAGTVGLGIFYYFNK